jgi:hypothetical protein
MKKEKKNLDLEIIMLFNLTLVLSFPTPRGLAPDPFHGRKERE